MGVKWLELLKQIAPSVKRGGGLAGPRPRRPRSLLGVAVSPANLRDDEEIERGIDGIDGSARGSNDGLIVTVSAPAQTHRDRIIALASPASATSDLSFPVFRHQRGPDFLMGPISRPVPAGRIRRSHKYDTVLNMNTAKALGLNCRRRCSRALTR
jgi:hypothetical protein